MTDIPVTKPALPRIEFIALIAMLFATVAFAIDSMLPAMPALAAAFTPADPDRAGLVITSFVFGMGLGTFFAGPLADRFGRKATILGGLALFAIGAALAANAWSLNSLLAARVIMGLGAAAPRVASMALIRDMFSGREMAQIVSFVMMVFMIVPAAAPAVGALVIASYGWRGVFWTFLVFAFVAGTWLFLRQPETLTPANRRPLHVAPLWASTKIVLTNRTALISIATQSMVFGCLFGTLSSIQPMFEKTFDKADSFPAWFALIALFSACASLTNALLVRRLGMVRVIVAVFSVMIVVSALMVFFTYSGLLGPAARFAAFIIWITAVFAMAGMTVGNLNALAMEPMGAIAGLAASVILAVPTILGTLIAAPLGLAFDGTPGPLAIGVTVCAAVALALMAGLRQR
ncbi:MAG: MFS transporter [Rhodobacteraceae bacterium]|jgi:MFS transporter, DHA1 family, multidrug resistance protein|nr:MFS transporter [Paracoccaceae bacterium]